MRPIFFNRCGEVTGQCTFSQRNGLWERMIVPPVLVFLERLGNNLSVWRIRRCPEVLSYVVLLYPLKQKPNVRLLAVRWTYKVMVAGYGEQHWIRSKSSQLSI